MKLKVKQLVAWIGGKGLRDLQDTRTSWRGVKVPGAVLDEAIPVNFVGHIRQEHDGIDYLEYGKRGSKAAFPFLVEVTSFSQEPFPLRLLLDIMDRAQAIREASWEDEPEGDSGYTITKDEAADKAVVEILGTDYEFLARFISLADHWWNDLEVLRNEMLGIAQAEVDHAKEAKAMLAPHEEDYSED